MSFDIFLDLYQNILILVILICLAWCAIILLQNAGADRYRREPKGFAWRGSQREINALVNSPCKPASAPDGGSSPPGSTEDIDAAFEAWGDNVPEAIFREEEWEAGVVPICDATLSLHSQAGWIVAQGTVVTPLHGPVRVKVLSTGMKAVEYDNDGNTLKVAHGYGPEYSRIRKLADDFPRQAAYGPEYEVELLDREGVVARLFLGSRVAKAALGGMLRPGAEVVLGARRVKNFFVPTGWRQLVEVDE